MMKSGVSKAGLLVLLGVLAGVFLFAGSTTKPNHVAAGGGQGAAVTTVPLLSCPNVDASVDNGVRVGDILAVVGAYFHDWPALNYYYLYDLADPYNPEAGTGGKGRVDDILAVVSKYFQTCPTVDTQVAQAATWAIKHVPMTPTGTGAMGETLAQLGYVQGSSYVPGQGTHFVKFANWDGTFDPQAPEGLVYTAAGRLGAELYVVNGINIGWIEDPEPNSGAPLYAPSGSAGSCTDGVDNGSDGLTDAADPDCSNGLTAGHPGPSDVDIDNLCSSSPCSWAGTEGWHLHYRLCTYHIGTGSAVALPMPPGANNASDCLATQNGTPCGGPGCPGTYTYEERVGWMGHLWSFLPNDNQVTDVNATLNGRFADCFPDTQPWTAYNCPR